MTTGTHFLPALATLLALGACSEPSSTQTLADRVAASLTPAELCNRQASIESLPNGTRIWLPEASVFVNRKTDLTKCGQYVLASVTQAMLAPPIMQVVIEPSADENAQVPSLSLQRADAVRKLMSNVGFIFTQPPVLVQPATTASPGNLGIELTVLGG
jgi:hypothetical protein